MHPAAPLDDLQTLARRLGWLFTALAAAMSGYAGWMFGGDSTFAAIVLAALLAGLTVAVAVMLSFIDAAWASGERALAAALALVFSLMVLGEYASHVAFGTGHRSANIERASIQTVRYDDTRDAVSEGKTNLAMWQDRLAQLEGQHAWAASVTADALRAQADAEARRGGCGPKCLELRARIAVAEETGTLRQQIAATKVVLDKHREKAATAERGDSVALNQAALLATVATGTLQPAASAVAWANVGIGAYLAMLSTGLGAVFNWLGFHNFAGRRPTKGVNPVRPDPAIASAPAAPVRPTAPQSTDFVPHRDPIVVHMQEQLSDEAFAKIRDGICRAIGRPATA